jgi:hypothetical protein
MQEGSLMSEFCTLALVLLPKSDAVSRAATIVIVSMGFIVFLSIIAFLIIRTVKRDVLEGNPRYAKDSAIRAQAELLAFAKKKQTDTVREGETARNLTEQKAQQEQKAEERRQEQESARETLLKAAEGGIGASCPHCLIEMAADEELVVCPACGQVQHAVCFDMGGCVNGCQVEYVYEYPEGKFRNLAKKDY